jgi:hypothetical protein
MEEASTTIHQLDGTGRVDVHESQKQVFEKPVALASFAEEQRCRETQPAGCVRCVALGCSWDE